MPRRLDSVNQGGFVERIEVVESELETVVDRLGITDARELETARNQIYRALEYFQTARSHTIKAKTIREDLGDLKELAETTNPETMTAPLQHAADVLESLRTTNPVLNQRLRWLLPGRKLNDRITWLADWRTTEEKQA